MLIKFVSGGYMSETYAIIGCMLSQNKIPIKSLFLISTDDGIILKELVEINLIKKLEYKSFIN